MTTRAQTKETPRILIVDDSVGPMKLSDFDDDFTNRLLDIDSPELSSIWQFGLPIEDLPDLSTIDSEQLNNIVTSQRFIENVLLNDLIVTALPTIYTRFIETDVNIYKQNIEWLKVVENCFPEADYELVMESVRPDPSSLLNYELVLLDLNMEDGSPIEETTEFLKKLSYAALEADDNLPSIIIVSSLGDDLQEHRSEFRYKANISASGLRILPKLALDSESGLEKLQLLYTQMLDEIDMSRALRGLSLAWEVAIKKSRKGFIKNLWNLDASSIQKMYMTALGDHAEFNGYMQDIMLRNIDWLLRCDNTVELEFAKIIKSLDSRIDNEHHDRFFIAPYNDGRELLELVTSHNWLPHKADIDISTLEINDLLANINEHFPFGSILSNQDVGVNTEVLLHTTQACDLAQHVPKDPDMNTLHFVKGVLELDIVTPLSRTNSGKGINDISGFVYNDTNYSMSINCSTSLACSVREMVNYLRDNKFRTIGRLRTDIASMLLHQYTDHIRRPANPVFAKRSITKLNIMLKYNNNEPVNYMDPNRDEEAANTMLVEKKKDKYFGYLKDDLPQGLAIWTESVVKENYDVGFTIEKEKLAGKIRNGLSFKHNKLAHDQLVDDAVRYVVISGDKTVESVNSQGNVPLLIFNLPDF